VYKDKNVKIKVNCLLKIYKEKIFADAVNGIITFEGVFKTLTFIKNR